MMRCVPTAGRDDKQRLLGLKRLKFFIVSGMARESASEAKSTPVLFGVPPRWIVLAVYVVCAVAFVTDITRTNELAYGVFYIPLVATALLHRERQGLWVLVALACILVLLGVFFPLIAPDLPDLIGNRILSILAILTTAAFVHHARRTQERLRDERRRAEAAERVKTEVFTNLSQEMRNPVQALVGLLNLMIAAAQPDQVRSLERVRSGSKQLLDTIDNLMDLTQIDDRELMQEPVDVAEAARQAVDAAQAAAQENAVALHLTTGGPAVALADGWAVRRILGNLLSHAIHASQAGGMVGVEVRQATTCVTVLVSAGGLGQSDAAECDDDLDPQAGTGMTLSQRLAEAMDGRLMIAGGPDPARAMGASVSLLLPSA